MTHKIRAFLFSLILLSLSQYGSFAQAPPLKNHSLPGTEIIPLDSEVKTGKLANGLTYFIRKNNYPEKRVVLYVATKAGSILETENQRGLAHFLEHMNFNGTTHFPKNELIDYLEKSGVKFGADLNAYTAFDETIYQLPLPSDNPEILKNGLQIIRDWAHGATLDPVEIDKERGVILEEKRSRIGLQERVMEKTFPILLNNSIYSQRLPIGTEKVIKNFKPNEIKAFYDTWYRPNLQAVIIVGDIDPIEMEAKVKSLFSDLKNPVNEQRRPIFTVPLSGKKQFISFTDPEAQFIQIQILNKFNGKPVQTKQEYYCAVVRNIFNQMLASRFSKLQQVANLPYISANAVCSNYLANLDVFNFSATLKPDQLEAGFKNAYSEIIRINKDGFTQAELDFCKTSFYSGLDNMLKEKEKTPSANYVREYVNYFTKNEAAPGIDTEYQMSKNALTKITLDEVNSMAKSLINLPDQDIIVTGPENAKENLPSQTTIIKWIKELDLLKPEAYVANNTPVKLMNKKPIAGTVISKKDISGTGATEYTLSNGIKIVSKPTQFKNDEILIRAFKAGGTSLVGDHDYISASNASSIIAAGGVADFNLDELSRLLNGKNVNISPYINELYAGFTGSSSVNDLETAMQLIHLYATRPRKDVAKFNNIISRTKLSLSSRSNNADAIFSDTIAAVLGNFNVRRITPDTSTLKKLSLDQAYEFYKSNFSNANGFTFIFTGSFKPQELIALCEQYLGSLPSNLGTQQNFVDLGIRIPKGMQEHLVYQGSNPRSTVKLVLSGEYKFSQVNNLSLLALSDIIEFRLTQRLRETEGGVYTPQVNVGFNKYPESNYAFDITFICSPENAQKLASAAMQEIKSLSSKGISDDDLNKFKAEKTREFETQQRTNDYWSSYLLGKISNNQNTNDVNSYQKEISDLTAAGLRDDAKKYLSGENLLKFILYPKTSK
ncbi:M16 family metallopeptidase [Pedobacter frigidisoli]|uniref:M16 family metallopeptidase n=1 Tax=Pedobacter frigidisoli TaxID=2530455 RepID=UPI00292F00E9|nr:insulinase family protein [Pedobacter frigidisoli]